MSPNLNFGVLGPLELRVDGRVVPLSAGKPRVVLATLLLNYKRTVPISELIDKLWHDSAPADPRATVQKYIMRLRRTIGGELTGEVLRTEPEGYRLRLPSGLLDLEQFDVLIDKADRAASKGDLIAEAATLVEALRLWRSVPPLADVPSDALQRREVRQLVERYLQALERRIELDLALGRHASLCEEIVGLVGSYPLRERFWAQWMLALHGAGRQGESLLAYHEVSRLLADELGVDPGPELQAAQRTVLQKSAPESPAAGLQPAEATLGPGDWIPVRQLPMPSAGFVGREAELSRLANILDDVHKSRTPAVMVITGPPGVGKTTLAVRAAHQFGEKFTDGHLFADLRGYASETPLTSSEVLGRFLGALGVSRPPLDVEQQILAYRSLLATRRILVLLDNVGSVSQARALLPGSAGSAVIVTSRNELGGLVVSPGAERISLSCLSTQESHRLLETTVGARRTAAEQAATENLAALCDGLALALRIASTHLQLRPHLTIGEFVEQLRTQDRVSAFSVMGDDISLATTFDWSYQRLSQHEQRLLRHLSLIPGRDFTAAAAAALVNTTGERAARGLEQLADASLLEREARQRYRLHDLTQVYAGHRFRIEGSEPARLEARRRLFDYYIGTVDAVVQASVALSRLDRPPPPPLSVDPEAALATLEDDRAAMVAAVLDAAKQGPHEAAFHLADALRGFFAMRGHTTDWLITVEAGLAAARSRGDDEAVAAMLNSRGALRYYMGNVERAGEDFEAALKTLEGIASPMASAVHLNLGNIAQDSGDLGSAVRHFEAAIAGHHRSGEQRLELRARENLILAYLEHGHLVMAQDRFEPLAEHATQPGRYKLLGIAAMIMAYTADLTQAVRGFEQAVTSAEANGGHYLRSGLLSELSACYLETGRDELAYEVAVASIAAAEQIGHRVPLVARLTEAGVLALRNEVDRARECLGQVLLKSRESKMRGVESDALRSLAELETTAGAPHDGMNLAVQALEVARQGDFRLQQIRALLALSRAQRLDGLTDDAQQAAQEALGIARESGYPLGEGIALIELGEIRVRESDISAAIRHWQRAIRLLTAIGSRHASDAAEKIANFPQRID